MTPSTPSSSRPINRSKWRFHPLGTACEWVEGYRPGGFHPTHLGDVFDNGRYRVIRKLGYGSFSTVWLAVDEKLHRYVAIKIVRAATMETSNEVSMLKYLNTLAKSKGQLERVITLLDHFHHQGPNGRHLCLILEAMGPSAASMVEELPSNLPRGSVESPAFPLSMAKEVLRQALLALEFLHQDGIAQGDFQPGNLLFSVPHLELIPEERLRHCVEGLSRLDPVKRLDGKEDKWAPKYLTVAQPLAQFADLGPKLVLKLSDVAFRVSSQNRKPNVPLGLRAPEYIVDCPLDEKIDIWSFGCLVYQFIIGYPLFNPVTWKTPKDDVDDEHLLMMVDTLGGLPDEIISKWPRANTYFGPNKQRLRWDVGVDGGERTIPPLEELIREPAQEKKLSDADIELVLSLLAECLQLKSTKRSSATKLLQHSFFSTCKG